MKDLCDIRNNVKSILEHGGSILKGGIPYTAR